MTKTVIDKDKRRAIISETYRCLRNKERNLSTKSATVAEIVKAIKKELKENAD